jgi:hypothetical protein
MQTSKAPHASTTIESMHGGTKKEGKKKKPENKREKKAACVFG